MAPNLIPSSGKRIVTACADNTFIYWDPRSPTPLFKLTGNDARFDLGGITALAVNPASTIAVVGGAEGGVRVISLSKGEVISALGGPADGESVEVVAFINIVGAVDGTSAPAGSASSNTVVTGATDSKVCIKTNRLRTTLEHDLSPTFCSRVTFAVRQSFLMLIERRWSTGCRSGPFSAPNKTTLRDFVICGPYPPDVGCARWALVREHKGHEEPINGAALGQGGEIVVSAGDDGACLVFGTG